MSLFVAAPLLAHVLNGGGPLNVLLLLVGGSAAIAGARIRARGTRTRTLGSVVAVVGMGLFFLGLGVDSGPSPTSSQARVKIVQPLSGDEVAARQPIDVSVELENGRLALSPSDAIGGHLHLYVDGLLQQMPYSMDAQVTLDPGRHTLTVEYVDFRHVSFDPEVASTIEIRAV
jgi:hypothetical protein